MGKKNIFNFHFFFKNDKLYECFIGETFLGELYAVDVKL